MVTEVRCQRSASRSQAGDDLPGSANIELYETLLITCIGMTILNLAKLDGVALLTGANGQLEVPRD